MIQASPWQLRGAELVPRPVAIGNILVLIADSSLFRFTHDLFLKDQCVLIVHSVNNASEAMLQLSLRTEVAFAWQKAASPNIFNASKCPSFVCA